jgi:hypothetical protein
MLGRVELGHTRTCGRGPAWARKAEKLVGAMLGAVGAWHEIVADWSARRSPPASAAATIRDFGPCVQAQPTVHPGFAPATHSARVARVVPWTHFWYVHVSLSFLLSYYYFLFSMGFYSYFYFFIFSNLYLYL